MGKDIKICIGMISYLPDNNMRQKRIDSMQDLFKKLDELFKDIPVMIITQNWKDYCPKTKLKLIREDHEKGLGIIKARINLREKFINSEFDYMIMLDDDAIIGGTDASDYIKEIKDHPDGFGWFSNHLLKLFAISKNVYSQIEMPNISAEKFEGFEDKLFISMCRIRFPELEFKFSHDKLTETSYLVHDTPSTWWNSETSKRRQEMRNKTDDLIRAYMKKYNNTTFVIPGSEQPSQRPSIKKPVSSPPRLEEVTSHTLQPVEKSKRGNGPIDLVITYVNNQDRNWQALYSEYKNKETQKNSEQSTNLIRFRDPGTLRYLFRSIEKNCSWFNKVFLVVQNSDQVPKWVNRSYEKIRIVYHDEYIPKELLPTFNSNTIEMYLSNIEDLSNNYILCNDDTFFFSDIDEGMFFRKNLPVYAKKEIPNIRPVDDFYKTIYNNQLLLTKILGKHKEYWHAHLQQAHVKSVEKELLSKHWGTILNSFKKSHFRNITNLTPWFYDDYLRVSDYGITVSTLYDNSKNIPLNSVNEWKKYDNYKLICINDTSSTHNFDRCASKLRKFLYAKFRNKSGFELFDLSNDEKADLNKPEPIEQKSTQVQLPSNTPRKNVALVEGENVESNKNNSCRYSTERIDVVINFVDKQNKEWQRQFKSYKARENNNKIKNNFYNLDTLKYTLRSIEQNCKWVNRIFLVVPTKDHVPEWLNITRKIIIVEHNDFIPKELLPTFNDNVVELFISNIDSLSNNYILCNEGSMFMMRLSETQFFISNKLVYDKIELTDDLLEVGIYSNNSDNGTILKEETKDNYKNYWQPNVQQPHKKVVENNIINKYYDKILSNFKKSHFSTPSNYTSELFSNYIKILNLGVLRKGAYNGCKVIKLNSSTTYPNRYKLLKFELSEDYSNYEEVIASLKEFLESNFNSKSRFEK